MAILDLMNILLMVIIFIISLAILFIITKVRELENSTVKTIAYIVLGLVMFTLIGISFNLWENPSSGDLLLVKDIVITYTQFYPALMMAMALAATVLVAYTEKDNYAYYFAGTGFAVLLPDLYLYMLGNGRYDLALVGCALWAVIPAIWAYFWKEKALKEIGLGEKVLTSFKAAFFTYPIYILTAIIAVFGETPRGIDQGAISSLAQAMPDVIKFILVSMWLFYLISIIIVTLMFLAHDLVLQLLKYRRVVDRKGIRYEKILPATSAAPKPKVNHYAGLINEMQVFSKYIGEVDRIRAASTIGRFKNEYQTLAVKYNEDSKADAEKIIKSIEQEFMQKY